MNFNVSGDDPNDTAQEHALPLNQYLKPWQAVLMFVAVAAFVFFLIYLSARHGIHWPILTLLCICVAGWARMDLDEDDYLP